MSAYRGANQGRKELKGWYKNKTDAGKVIMTSTYKPDPTRKFVWKARSPK